MQRIAVSPTQTYPSRRGWLPALALTGVITMLALPVLTYPPGADQGEFAVTARAILDGRVPYVEIWNPKPPAVFYVYGLALGLLGDSPAAIRALDLLLFPLIAAGLYGLGRRLAGHQTALLALAFFGGVYFSLDFWTLTQNDGLAAAPMTLAVWWIFCALESGRAALRWLALAGMAAGLALWFKYPFVLFAILLPAGYALSRSNAGESRQLWRELGAFVCGGTIIAVGGTLLLAAQGALTAWVESALVTTGYARLGLSDLFSSVNWQHTLREWWLWPQGVIVVGWLLARRRWPRPERPGWHIVWLWLLAGLGAAVIQGQGYGYHFLLVLPPLTLLAADLVGRSVNGVVRLPLRTRILALLATALPLCLLLTVWLPALPYLSGGQTQEEYYRRFRGGDFLAAESLAVAEYLRARTTPGDSLYIWGFRAEVYFLSGLRPATRFPFHYPLVGDWYPPEWQQENVDTLWAALPPFALVLRGDYLPWVTGREADSHELLQEYTELNNWLIHNYEREAEIGPFLVWRRR
jgi:4-amino-4-deoxy-L-arabinose transferase-like glycosyltransferase